MIGLGSDKNWHSMAYICGSYVKSTLKSRQYYLSKFCFVNIMLILYQFYINSVPKNLYKFATILLNMDLTSSPPPFITKMLEKLQYCRGMASLIVSSAPRMMAGLWSSLHFPDIDYDCLVLLWMVLMTVMNTLNKDNQWWSGTTPWDTSEKSGIGGRMGRVIHTP